MTAAEDRKKARAAAAQRKEAADAEQKAVDDAADLLFDIEVHWPDDDEPTRYQVRRSLLTWQEEKALLRICDFTIIELQRMVAGRRYAAVASAAIVFLAELQANGGADFGEIAGRLQTYDVLADWAPAPVEDSGEGDRLGEAPGADSPPS